MKKFLANKIFILILIVVTIIGVGKLINKWKHEDIIATTPILTNTEKSKVIINPASNKVTVVRRSGDKQVIRNISGSRKVSITLTKSGELKTYIPTKGFIFEPGIMFGMDIADSLLGLDTQFFYWGKVGLFAGLSAPPHKRLLIQDLRAHLAFGYNMADLKMPNTNVFAGYNTKKSFMIGLRVRF